jgi:hypothetical protein
VVRKGILCPDVVFAFAGPPNFPFNCRVVNVSDDYLTVFCSFSAEKSRNSSWTSSHLFLAKWQDQSRILVHPLTHYHCEAFDAISGRMLANETTDAASRRGNQSVPESFLHENQAVR